MYVLFLLRVLAHVIDEKVLEENLAQMAPRLLELVHVDDSLVDQLQAHHVLDIETKDGLTVRQ